MELLTDNWDNPPRLNEGERMLRLIDRSNELYAIVSDDMDEEEIESEIRLALRKKFGKGHEYNGYEDASHICEHFE